MLANAMRKKVIEYVNHADEKVLEVVYKMLLVYEGDGSSLMDSEQKDEVTKRSVLLKEGKLKTSTWAEVKAKARLPK